MSGASEPGSPDVPNEDWWGATPRVVVVLDGVTLPAGMEGGCQHGTPWYVRQLGTRILKDAEVGGPLDSALWYGIERVAHLHRRTCDLSSLGSPSAAVGIVRLDGDRAEYLVLADVTIAVEGDGSVEVITDDRVEASLAGVSRSAPGATALIAERRAAHRNQPGGYWVAAAEPDAAGRSVTGTVEGARWGAVMTDGAAAIHNMTGTPWAVALAMPAGDIIARVRAAEQKDPARAKWPRWKVSDDATVVTWQA